MQVVSIDVLEEDLKLFLTNPETTNNLKEAATKAKEILLLKKDSSIANYALALNEVQIANMTAPMADYTNSIKNFKKLIKVDPNFIEPYLMLAKIYKEIDKQKQYEILCKANDKFPDHYLIMYDLAQFKLYKTGEKQEALKMLARCAELLPQVDSAWASLGVAYLMNRDLEMAKVCYETALTLNPEQLTAMLGVGVYHFENGNLEKARECFDKSMMVNKDSFWGRFNLGLLELLEGNYEKGWEIYEKRDKQQYLDKYGGSGYREMQIDDVSKGDNGKVIIIREQGFGDDIMFARYLKPLQELGYEITFMAPPEMLELFKMCPELDDIKINNSMPEKDPAAFDYRAFLMSLPWLTSRCIKNKPLPLKIDLKRLDEKKVKFPNKIKKLLDSKKLKVGLSWSGSPKHWRDANRSIDINLLKNLFKNKDVEFFAIQKVYKKEDKNFIRKIDNLHNCDEYLKDFLHTAYLVDKMDVILTVDTSLVHLAGSMGKETYLYLPVIPDWRWGLNDTQQWYPSVSLLRQKSIDDWGHPISKSASILNKKLSGC